MENRILRSISYFDIFNHPITKEELRNLCLDGESFEVFDSSIESLVSNKKCYLVSGYYSLRNNTEDLVIDRQEKERKAIKYFSKLPSYVRLIKLFPFVRGLAISGSLSKSVMDDDGDIDYFVITAPGRLWICRTLLILFKKVFLFNSKKYFCVNYFVDENNLEIIDKNIFTSVEVTYLAPVYNQELFNRFKELNSWTRSYFPRFNHPLKLKVWEGNASIKSAIEFILMGNLGDRLDLFFMKLTYNQWSKKFKNFNSEKFELTMRSNRGVSKHHPQDFQNKVLNEYHERKVKLGIS